MKKNIYNHAIELKPIHIRNAEQTEFAKRVTELEYRGYEVESLANGNKIVITKPGGKRVWGRPYKEDFIVFIHNPATNELWQITHNQIFEDVVEKSKENAEKTRTLIDMLRRVLRGEEPQDFIEEIRALSFNAGESPETLLKVYKWIWGQEDVNYPNKEGRFLSWHRMEDLYAQLAKSPGE